MSVEGSCRKYLDALAAHLFGLYNFQTVSLNSPTVDQECFDEQRKSWEGRKLGLSSAFHNYPLVKWIQFDNFTTHSVPYKENHTTLELIKYFKRNFHPLLGKVRIHKLRLFSPSSASTPLQSFDCQNLAMDIDGGDARNCPLKLVIMNSNGRVGNSKTLPNESMITSFNG